MTIYSIYRATNKINNKVYIGYTGNFEVRLKFHKRDSLTADIKFYRAIRKHGWDNFVFEIIYQSKDKKHTHKVMEPAFIVEYDSIKNGYNTAPGGEGNTTARTEKWKQEHSAEMKRLAELGLSNLTDALRQKIVDEGKNLLYSNSDWHRKNTEQQLANNKHASQIIKTCEHCGTTCDSANYSRSHGDRCFALTKVKIKIAKHPPRVRYTCEVCNTNADASNFKRYNHGANCKRVKIKLKQ